MPPTKTPQDDESAASSDDDSSDEPAIESLVAGRAKRVTAGNRLTSLLAKEGNDDELELLFAEDEEEEDVEFDGHDGDDASDVDLASSSSDNDDDDHGPAGSGDDLEGEKAIQQQDRAERKQKRKALDLFKKPPASRPKTQPLRTATPMAPATPLTPAAAAAAARPKKKSERISWIPAADDVPVRSSSRKQTVQNKEAIHLRMQASEEKRRRQLRIMAAAAQRKEATKPRARTQADRLAEAARTETTNAHSLNRWEEAEKKRSAEQKARLAALHDRQLPGPVTTYWSGPAQWRDGRLVAVGARTVDPDIAPHSAPVDGDTVMSDAPPPPPPTQIPIVVTPIPGPPMTGTLPSHHLSTPIDHGPPPSAPVDPSMPMPAAPPVIEYSARNLVILKNFDGHGTPPHHILLPKKEKRASKVPSKWESPCCVAP